MMSEILNLPPQVAVAKSGDSIRIEFGDLRTSWISADDPFIERIRPDRLNRYFLCKHLAREIEMKNVLDNAANLLDLKSYAKAISELDRVIYYDGGYSEALFLKSQALYHQGHFVKALRFYKRSHVEDVEYYRLLLEKSSKERDSFPKIKKNIYAGDEAAAKGDYERAIGFYDRALENPSKFKKKILFKLLNKKASCLIRLNRFDEALASFDVSLRVHENDFAHFGKAYSQHMLGMDCISDLKRAKSIDKKCLLIKASILNELGLYEDAMDAFNVFLNNHFTLDLDFKSAIEGKAASMDNLGLDFDDLKVILNDLK